MFDIKNTLSFNTDELVSGCKYDYVTRTSQNQGVLQKTGYVNSQNINLAGNWSLGLLQMDFFYRKNPWYAGQFVRKVIPKVFIPPLVAPFLTTVLNRLTPLLMTVLVRNVDETFLNSKIVLPINGNGDVNFDFMARFITELEAGHIEELEAYLLASGLNDYVLTQEEQKSIGEFENLEWGEFKIGTLFERIKTKKLPFKAEDLPKQKIGEYILPCLTSSFNNQGLNYFAPKKQATILKDVISIPSNSDVYRAYFQPNEFTVLSDAYAIRWIYNSAKLSPNQYLLAVQCINKVTDLPIYSYKNKLGGWNVVKDKYIQLPIKNGEPDYTIMDLLVSAVKKLIIKDLVIYTDSKIVTS